MWKGVKSTPRYIHVEMRARHFRKNRQNLFLMACPLEFFPDGLSLGIFFPLMACPLEFFP
ncbi:MAG: hypothetical protein ACI856_002854 [Kiritimatiellia bacterium]